MEKADVVVAGGGPGGLATALTCARAGLRTVVLEREQEIGLPVHTSGGTSVHSMRKLGIPDECFHVVDRLRIVGPNTQSVFDFAEPTAAILDVTQTYQHLAKVARNNGAVIETGSRVVSVISERNTVVGCNYLTASGETAAMRSRVLVDSSGYRASLSKQAGLHKGFVRYGVGAEYELLAPKCSQTEAVLVVGSEYAPSGYAWVFPWGANRVRVGVGILHTDSDANPRTYLTKFVESASSLGVDLADSNIVESHFGLIPSDGLADRFVSDGIVAVGDAAGQASLVVGEGIRLSIAAGYMAGESIAKFLHTHQPDLSLLREYERAFRAKHGFELKIGFDLNRRMGKWTDAEWDRKVRIAADIPAQFFAEILQSQFSIGHILRFMATRPSMWPRVSRYAARSAIAYFRQ